MTNKQNAKLNMAQRVHDILNAHSSLFASIVPMQHAFEELGSVVSSIRKAEQEQGGIAILAASLNKATAEKNMIDSALQIANCLYVEGINTRNNNLQIQAHLTTATFINSEDNEKLALAQRISDLAANYAAQLEAFGMNTAERVALMHAIGAYNTVIAKPMDTIGEHKQKTTNLQLLFPQLKSILEDKLDKMMILFKYTQPAFYDQYKTARNIINTAVRHRKPEEDESNGGDK